ncbi:MAG: hypothetical protein LBE22_10385 [Azoarcus sp.]|jgi:hypothetical protein|nr:hypothetical protein [Azoarcus sp.]
MDTQNYAESKLRADEAAHELRNVLSTRHGINVFKRILFSCGVFHTTFHTDAAMAAFSEGRRSVGVELLSAIKEAFPSVLAEVLGVNDE